MNIYLENGYLNFEEILKTKAAYIFIVGGRGVGKTYGAIRHVLEHQIPFMLMRRTQSQTDLINIPDYSPVKPVADDMGLLLTSAPVTKWNSRISEAEEIDGKLKPTGQALGYTCALSTIANMRGFDASWCKVLIFDEFIAEPHERPIRAEGKAFLNAYETINRNRELKGGKPLQVLALANAFDIANPIFAELDLIDKAAEMLNTGTEIFEDERRGILLIIPQNSPISEQKTKTALYQVASADFKKMSIENRFKVERPEYIRKRPLKEYKPIVTAAGLTVYLHKSKPELYVIDVQAGACPEYADTEKELTAFRRDYSWLIDAYYDNQIYYPSYQIQNNFKNLLTAK